jgi:hypothetical protein
VRAPAAGANGRYLQRSGLQRRAHRVSAERKFTLELRVNLVILFGLAALATATHVSIMLAVSASASLWPRSANPVDWPASC